MSSSVLWKAETNKSPYFPQLWVKWYHYCSSTRMTLTHEGWFAIKQRNLSKPVLRNPHIHPGIHIPSFTHLPHSDHSSDSFNPSCCHIIVTLWWVVNNLGLLRVDLIKEKINVNFFCLKLWSTKFDLYTSRFGMPGRTHLRRRTRVCVCVCVCVKCMMMSLICLLTQVSVRKRKLKVIWK